MAVELKDFIKNALADISTAVKESQKELANVASVSPSYARGSETTDIKWADNIFSKVSTVEFDVAVTSGSTESNTGEMSGGITVLGMFSVGAAGKHTQANSIDSQHISRIRFSIPIAFAPDNTRTLSKFYEKNQ